MSSIQAGVSIAVIALATLATRALPFVLFPANRSTPMVVVYLGRVLPCAVMAMLVVYCLKDIDPLRAPHAAPKAIALAVVAGLYLWRRSSLLAIAGGSVLYMALVQAVFR